MLSANRDFDIFLLYLNPFNVFSFLIAPARESKTILNRSGERGEP
jgi:hypothetical protein